MTIKQLRQYLDLVKLPNDTHILKENQDHTYYQATIREEMVVADNKAHTEFSYATNYTDKPILRVLVIE